MMKDTNFTFQDFKIEKALDNLVYKYMVIVLALVNDSAKRCNRYRHLDATLSYLYTVRVI